MAAAHRCYYCGRVSRNVMKFYDAGSICGRERYVCLAQKICMKHQQDTAVLALEKAKRARAVRWPAPTSTRHANTTPLRSLENRLKESVEDRIAVALEQPADSFITGGKR